MSTSVTVDPAASLTPSELVLLHGEKFAKKAMLGNTELLHIDAKVSTAKTQMFHTRLGMARPMDSSRLRGAR